MIALSKEIWEVLLKKNKAISVEYLPSTVNKEADWESWNSRESSNWKLSPLGYPQIDLLSARKLSFLETRPTQQGGWYNTTKLVSWIRTHPICFPPFSLIPRVLCKIEQDQVHTMILVVPVWQTQLWCPRLLQLLIANPSIIPHTPNLLLNAQKELHPLVANKILRFAAWKVSGNPLLIQGYQSRLPVLSPVLEGQV